MGTSPSFYIQVPPSPGALTLPTKQSQNQSSSLPQHFNRTYSKPHERSHAKSNQGWNCTAPSSITESRGTVPKNYAFSNNPNLSSRDDSTVCRFLKLIYLIHHVILKACNENKYLGALILLCQVSVMTALII